VEPGGPRWDARGQGEGNKVEDLLGFHRQPPPAVTQVEWNRLESLGIKLLYLRVYISWQSLSTLPSFCGRLRHLRHLPVLSVSYRGQSIALLQQ